MRIQETDRILKESRYARNAAAAQQQDEGMLSRAWHMVSNLPSKLTGMFHNFLDLFVADDAALDTLDWYIQEWEVFNDNRLDEGGRGSLVEDIINANWDDDDALVGEAGVAPFVVPVRGFEPRFDG